MMNEIVERYLSTRRRTEALCRTLEVEDFVVQTAEFMSPPRWHLGHTTWLFEKILGQFLPDARPYREDFDFYFNSYYWRFGERIERGRRGTRSRPTVRETMAYRNAVDGRIFEFLEKDLEPASQRERNRLVRMAIEHEQQHQELLVWDVLHLLGDVFQVPTLPDALRSQEDALAFFGAKGPGSLGPKHDLKPVFVEGGLFEIGWQGEDFSWDNERPRHPVSIAPTLWDATAVTIGSYLLFMEDGGYDEARYWLQDGWNTRCREKWKAPLYWEREERNGSDGSSKGQWLVRDFGGLRTAQKLSSHPVSHVSYYEACAFAKWAGKRLPTEAEWEFAAVRRGDSIASMPQDGVSGVNAEHANVIETGLFGTCAVGSFAKAEESARLHDMLGNVWEWTASDYAPYPGFKPDFDEYNDKFFCNQRVLRGGSWSTPASHLRLSYRNFFYPHERWMTSGFRCVEDPA